MIYDNSKNDNSNNSNSNHNNNSNNDNNNNNYYYTTKISCVTDNIKHILISINMMTLNIIIHCEKMVIRQSKQLEVVVYAVFLIVHSGEKSFLTRCLCVLMFSDVFTESGRSFQPS